jgi:hypothetical protein
MSISSATKQVKSKNRRFVTKEVKWSTNIGKDILMFVI